MEGFKKHSTITGTVVGFNDHGCYVRDDITGKTVFYFGNGMKGDRVQLTVCKVNRELERVTCSLDTVLEYGKFVA